MNVTLALPPTDNFQHWPPWRALVVETAYADAYSTWLHDQAEVVDTRGSRPTGPPVES